MAKRLAFPTPKAAPRKRKDKANGMLAPSLAVQFWRQRSLTCAQALAKMPGWSIANAYRKLGRRNVQLGRRRNP